jgi:thiamine biosynthesis protein ThiI
MIKICLIVSLGGNKILYLVRYAELALKSEAVRRRWERALVEDIRKRIGDCKIRRERGRIWIDVEAEISEEMSRIFGIQSFSICEDCKLNELGESLIRFTEKKLKGEKTFGLRVRRIGKHDFTSQDVARDLGRKILERFPDLSVDLKKPEKEIFIEIRDENCYIFDEIIQGIGGLPSGVEGKVIGIPSAEIRSPIAIWMMMKRGCEIILDRKEEGREFIDLLRRYQPNLRFADHEWCVDALGVVTGEMEDPAFDIPIYRPLIGLEDEEIGRIGEKIGIKGSVPPSEAFRKRIVSLISDGIDSPVATYLMLKRGAEVVAIHFDNRPFSDDKAMDKSLALVNQIKNLLGVEIKMYVVPHGDNQVAFSNCKRNLRCILCKRMMLRIAEKIVEMDGADAILTGESLGQVASQTLANMYVTSQTVKTQIIRPLIGLDKIEIVDIAGKIGTYEISISPSIGCSIYPKMPATSARLEDVLREEAKIDIDSLVERSIDVIWKN